MKLTLTLALLTLLIPPIAAGQTPTAPQTSPASQSIGQTKDADLGTSSSSSTSSTIQTLPQAPRPQAPKPQPYDPSNGFGYDAGYLCGMGSTTSSVATKPTVGCGAGFTFVPLPIFVEIGIMGPQANRSYLSGYISVDGTIPLSRAFDHHKYQFGALLGYSRLFETGHSLDYGLLLYAPRPGKKKDSTQHIRIELRDYYTFANPTQHNIMLRVGWMSEIFSD